MIALETVRLDKWLWYARFFKSRSLAQRFLTERIVRLNRAPVAKASVTVKVGDVLTLPFERGVVVVQVAALGERRGPAAAARTLYTVIEPGASAMSLQAGMAA